jgi:prepilin-type processing-associated H-X9-DG protein
VQSAREAARRAQCVNNLKQLALGMHNYVTSNGTFPIGEGPTDGTQYDALAGILPYIDQGPVANAVNFTYSGADRTGWRDFATQSFRIQGNTTAWHLTLNIAQCPSDNRDALTLNFGHTNYAANRGSIPAAQPGRGAGFIRCDGLVCKVDGAYGCPAPPWNDPWQNYVCSSGAASGLCVPIADVTDGTSNTAAWGERIKGIGNNENDLVDPLAPATTYYALPMISGDPFRYFYDTAAALPFLYQDCISSTTVYNRCTCQLGQLTGCASSLNIVHMGMYWWMGLTSSGTFNTAMPPNSKFCTQGNENYWAQAFGTSSRHPGGVNMALADGSVKFLKNTISPPIMWALGSRNGGEVLNADQY